MKVSVTKSFKVNDVPCREWHGHRNGVSGHGQRWDASQQKVRGAHVMAWEEANGRSVEPGEIVRHRCDNPPCIEETHLVIGTFKDNRDDLVERHPERVVLPPRLCGEDHPNHKLTDLQVRELRASFTGARGEKASLARAYGISKTQVTNILRKRQRV